MIRAAAALALLAALGACAFGDAIREMDGFGPNNTPYTTIPDDPEKEDEDVR
jgi:hypothetical protein